MVTIERNSPACDHMQLAAYAPNWRAWLHNLIYIHFSNGGTYIYIIHNIIYTWNQWNAISLHWTVQASPAAYTCSHELLISASTSIPPSEASFSCIIWHLSYQCCQGVGIWFTLKAAVLGSTPVADTMTSQPYRVPLVNFTYTGHPTGMQWWSLQWPESGSPELMWSHCEAVKVLTTASWGSSCDNKMADTSQLYSITTCLYCCNNENNKVLLHQMQNSISSHLRKTSSTHVQFYTPVRSQCIPFILANSHTGIVFLTIYRENS